MNIELNKNPAPGWVVGVDIGGTLTKAVLVDPEGEPVGHAQRATPVAGGPEAVMAAVALLIAELSLLLPAGEDLAALGVAVPGAVDAGRGVVVEATNLGWRAVRLAEGLHRLVGLPVFVEHDVRSAALGELRYGQRAVTDFLFIALGTGVGGAVVTHGQVYTGVRQLAGEIGHVVVAPGGPVCGCGKRGCLEAIASVPAVLRRVRELGLSACLTGEDLAALVAAGEERATNVWHEAAEALALALANYTVVLDPEQIIVGGGMAEAGDLLLEPVRAAMARQLPAAYQVKVHASLLGAAAGRLGAATVARERLQERSQ
jgi:glucokinase